MNKKLILVGAILLLLPLILDCKKKKEKKGKIVSMVAATSVQSNLPFSLLDSEEFTGEDGAEYLKVHVYLDEPLDITRIKLNTCSSAKKAAQAFINFDEKVLKLDIKEGVFDSGVFKPASTRSVTVNFGENKDVCVKSFELYDAKAKPIALRSNDIVEGKVYASSTLQPTQSYSAMNLFDSRYEYAWASNKSYKDQSLRFDFDSTQKIDKIKLWNGYQRSPVHCYANARPKKIQLVGSDGYTATINVADILGPQVIPLPKPFEGRSLTLKIIDAYKGRSYKDLVISELRFGHEKDWFMLSPLSKIKSDAIDYRKKFRQAGLERMLNKSVKFSREDETATGEYGGAYYQNASADVRLRSDGSFYISTNFTSVHTTADGSEDYYYYALGNYEVREVGGDFVKLRIFGFLRIEGEAHDCNGCGHDCNRRAEIDPYTRKEEKIFQDFIRITNGREGLSLRNVSPKPKLEYLEQDLLEGEGEN